MIQLYIYLCSFSCPGEIYSGRFTQILCYALYICLPSVMRLSVKDLVTIIHSPSFSDNIMSLFYATSLWVSLKILIGFFKSESRSVVSDSLRPHGLYSPWKFPGQNTGVGSLSLLQAIFLAQGLKPGLPHCRRILYQLSQKASPRILECVACSFSSGSS